MDTRIVEVRKNIIINRVLTAETGFSWTINTITFIPDEVNVKLIVYNSSVASTAVSGIYTDMVQDIIGSFYDSSTIFPNLTFTLRKPILGQYNFQLVSATASPAPLVTRSGDLFIHLEFVKYRTDLPDKKIF